MIKAKQIIKRGVTGRLILSKKNGSPHKEPHTTQEEIDICLNCPYPKCIHKYAGCAHLKNEMNKIRENKKQGEKTK